MPARFQHTKALGPDLDGWHVIVPPPAHEAQPVRRIGHDGVHAAIWQRLEHLDAIALNDRHNALILLANPAIDCP